MSIQAHQLQTAVMLVEQGRYDEALAMYQAQIKPNEKNPQAWFHYGIAAAQSGDLSLAEKCFKRLLKLVPGNPDALSNLGLVKF